MNAIGIDLGTTTSEIAIFKDGQGEVIKNIKEGDNSIIPSVVLIEDNQIIVGTKAKNQMILKPENVILEIKRLMGKNKKIKINNKIYSPVEISSMILKKLKDMAEFYLGEKIYEAVITVPANFDNKAREDTKLAGKLAGIKVERIINEPTAAAIAYGIDKQKENGKILVYDFGGGTLDVTILELFDGVLDVKVSRGDNNLGGKDIDRVIMKHLIAKFEEETGEKLDLKSLRVLSALKKASEECKINLAFYKEWDVVIPYIGKDKNGNTLDINIEINRETLKELTKEIIDGTEKIIDEALKAAKLKAKEIDKIVLVGGSTRLIEVRELIKNKFGEEKIVSGVNPDEAVAIGAAIQADIKNKNSNKIVVTDVANHTLGVEVLGGKFDSIIERDSSLPTEVTKLYKTAEDNQEEATINIYQGEEIEVKDNTLIGVVEINNIPRNKKGKEIIEITFKYDLNGILNTKIKVESTGNINEKIFKKGRDIEEVKIEKTENQEELEDVSIDEAIKEDTEIIKEKDRENIEEDMQEVEEVEIEEIEIIEDVQKVKDIEERENIEVIEEMKEEVVEAEKVEENKTIEENTENINNEEEEEEEDYSNIYAEVVGIVNYANANMESYEKETQDNIKLAMQDLLVGIKKNDFKECRKLERKILKLVGIE